MSRVRITCAIVALFVVGIDLDLARAQPVDSPTKLSLDTSKESIDRLSQASPSKWQQGMVLHFKPTINSIQFCKQFAKLRDEQLFNKNKNSIGCYLKKYLNTA